MNNKEKDYAFGNLINDAVKEEAKASDIKTYLKKMRSKSAHAPSVKEISDIVKKVRADRYSKQ